MAIFAKVGGKELKGGFEVTFGKECGETIVENAIKKGGKGSEIGGEKRDF
jgi:hypothetical protein